jgi:hypothetical protein
VQAIDDFKQEIDFNLPEISNKNQGEFIKNKELI